jgi:hypothetical protein
MDKSMWWDAYKTGYDLGVQCAKQYFARKSKKNINVNYIPSHEVLKMEKLDCGGMLNLGGRSLPF